jgi:hypothetical protein
MKYYRCFMLYLLIQIRTTYDKLKFHFQVFFIIMYDIVIIKYKIILKLLSKSANKKVTITKAISYTVREISM